jgi:hypothetical protein
MSWLDSAADLHSLVGPTFGTRGRSSWNAMPTRSTSFHNKLKTYGYDFGSHNVGWGDLASGRVPPAVGTTKPVVDEPWKQPPAKFDVAYPTSFGQSRLPAHVPVNAKQTEGLANLPGNVFGAVSDVASNLNFGNAVPWFMERVAVLAHAARDSNVPIVKESGAGLSLGLDAFTTGVTAASDAIAPVMEAFPNYVRDGQLHDRAKVYQALVNGGTVDWGANGGGLLGTGLLAGPIGNPIETAGELMKIPRMAFAGGAADMVLQQQAAADQRITGSVSAQANALNEYRDILLHSVDPQKRLNAEQAMALLKESIDIPMSVKLALEASPGSNNEDIQKAIDAAPEGKAWSYRAGPEGVALNMATPLLFYLAEAKGFGSAAGAVSKFGAGSSSVLGAGARGLGTGLTAAAKLQSYAFKAGVGTTILTTTADAIARTVGDQAAVDWFDKANQTALFSDNPNVQLVTSFSVNPLDGTLGAAKGVYRVGHGLADVALDATLGKRFSVLHDQPAWLNEMTRRVYNLKNDKEAVAWMDDPTHLNRDQMLAHVVQIGLEAHVLTLPTAERAHIGALPAFERMTYVLNTYGKQAIDLLNKDPDAVIKAYQKRAAEHHGYKGGYDAPVAAMNDLDYRLTTDKTMELRGNLDAVVSYREALPPEAQTMARDFLDTWTAADGTIPVRGLESINHLIKNFPILKDFGGGYITDASEGARVPRATVERMIDEATAHYQSLEQTNPVRAHTGRDPVLRPSSPTHARDVADAVGTNLDTINAIDNQDIAAAADVELARQFLVDRKVLDKAAADALTPEEAMRQSMTHLSETIKPWVETGQRVETAEKQLGRYRQGAASERAAGRDGARLDMEAAKMAKIISDAGDPLRTFAETAAKVDGPRIAPDLMARAARKVDARIRLGVIEGVQTELGKIDLELPSLDSVVVAADGTLAWAPDVVTTPPQGLLDAFVRFKTSGPYSTIRKTVGHYTAKHTEEIFTDKAQAWIDLADQGSPAQQWQAIADSPGFLAYLRKQGDAELGASVGMGGHGLTGNAAADLIGSMPVGKGRSTLPLSQIAEAMGVEPKVALQKLAEMKRSYHDALDGRTEANLRRTRETLKGEKYADAVRQAEENAAVRDLVFDPEYEAWGLSETIAKVAEITNNPTDRAMWSALRPLFEGDDAVAAGVENVAQRLGVTADDILGDPVFADAVKAELVPAGFIAPDGLVKASEAIDQALLNGDNLTVAELARKVADPKPTRVTGSPTKPRVFALGAETGRVAHRYRPLDNAIFDEYVVPLDPDPTYLYHLTTESSVVGIADRGLTAKVPDDVANAAGVYLTDSSPGLILWAKSHLGDNVVLRTRREPSIQGTGSEREYISASIPADRLEFYGADNKWHPMGDARASAASAKASAATIAKRIPKLRKSYRYTTDLQKQGADLASAPDEAILSDPRNALGLDAMSVINYGALGTRPQTLAGVIEVLRQIEDRHLGGLGTDLAAEAQKVARTILDRAISQAKAEIRYEAGTTGTIGQGRWTGTVTNPRTGVKTAVSVDKGDLAESLTRLLKYDDSNPLSTLQYGLKKRAKASVVFEWAAVPGLAEEMVTKNFKTWEERVWTAETRKVYNYVFGPTSNSALRTATQTRFMELAGAKGVDAAFAKDVFDVWHQESATSGTFRVTRDASKTIGMEVTGNPLYADVWNIPNGRLNVLIHGSKERNLTGLIDDYAKRGLIDAATAAAYKKVDFADLFRTSGSFTKRQLGKVPGKLGEDMAALYGVAAHNKAVTTLYFTFRFGLDIRFHAQNYFEAQILGAGMAGFRKREVAFGEFGMDSNYLHHLESNEGVLANTGTPLTQSRHATAYDTFLRMKGDPLREATKGLASEDPMLLEGVLKRMGYDDAVTADMVKGIKANPDDFIRELDAWHGKMLKNTSAAEDGAVIDQEIAAAMAENPEMAEVLTRLAEVNKGTWDDVRKVMYGNPERSRAERLLNSYWLYWPLSYQIKATKWFAKVLFDSVGGLKTNASGAWLFNEMATTHQQQLATNPKYQAWFEKHKTLVFMAQMLMPVSFDKVGVSLNPFVRNRFFGGSSDVTNIGPIYTLTGLVPDLVSENYVDLYPTFGDYLMRSTRQKPTKAQQQEVTDRYGAPTP